MLFFYGGHSCYAQWEMRSAKPGNHLNAVKRAEVWRLKKSFILSNGIENFSLTSIKSVNFWVDFLLNAKVYSKKNTRYAYYIIWTYCRKILRVK